MTNLMTFRPLLAFSGPLLCTVKIKRIINLIKKDKYENEINGIGSFVFTRQ